MMSDALRFLEGGGEMGALMRAHDWSSTPLGTPDTWPQSLHATLSACLNSPLLGTILWGPDLRMLYNDGYIPSLADHHPAALGQPVGLVWGDAWEQVSPAFHQAMATGEGFSNANVELSLFRNGRIETTYWDFTAAPIRGEDGSIVGLLNQGVETTEQVATLHALAQSEARLRDLNETLEERIAEQTAEHDRMWDTSPDLMLVIDFEGVFQRVNPAWTALLGYGLEELVGHHVNEFVVPDDHRDTITAYETAADGGLATVENRYRHKDGSIRYISWMAAPAQSMTYATGRDVTVAKERAAELRRYRDIVEATVAPICAFDTNYRLVAFNHAHNDEFRRVNGFESKLGDVLPELFVAEQRTVMHALMRRALSGESFTVVESFGQPHLGIVTWEISYTPLFDGQGRVVGAFHQANDISDRLTAEVELDRAQEALRQSQKMEAVGQLTGGVAHDFNNLLTVIRGSVDLLRRPDLSDERRQRYIDAIADTSDRAAKLTGQLLAFARRQTLKPEVFNATASVRAISDMLQTLTGVRVKVALRLPSEPCYVDADRSQFDTAIVNMAVNARDAMKAEGQLTITVGTASEMPAIRSHPAVSGEFITVSLTDSGPGVPVHRIDQIFEPFFTTKGVGEGTGLGLSQVFGFTKQSGGDIFVESIKGEGATFTMYLPRVEGADCVVAELGDNLLPLGEGACVLVVEDNAEVGMFATQALAELGYNTVLAMDAPKALAELATGIDRFQIVFSDVMMPGMSGLELREEIGRLYPSLPVMLTSGYSGILAQGGKQDFELLHKPYSMDALSKALRKALQL